MAGFEFGILYFLQGLHTPWLDWLMKVVTSLGDGGWFWITTGCVLFCFGKTRRVGAAMLLSLLAGFVVGNVALKNLVARSRPCWLDPGVALLVSNPKDYSFPSGHALASFEGAMSIYLGNRRWGAAALCLAGLIGLSRLYLFVHFPTDVLAGALLGVGIALAADWFLSSRFCSRWFGAAG